MRNLKRVLALALALVMTIGLLVIGSSAVSYKDYTDTDQIDPQYNDAVQVLSDIGVFRGTSLTNEETFSPKQILDRQSASTLVYRVLTGDVTDAQLQNYAYPSEFSDVKETSWANPYINYAAIVKYVVGDGTGRFLPTKEVTGVEVLTIMLRAIGYGQNDEFTGAGWKDETITKANELGLLAGISTDDLISGASRELVAQLLFNAITIPNTVTYSAALGYVKTENPLGVGPAKNPTLGYKIFKLVEVKSFGTDVWGRDLGSGWTYTVNGKAGQTILHVPQPLATYYEATAECDIIDDTELSTKAKLAIYVNGIQTDDDYQLTDSEKKSYGEQGRQTEVYADRIVNIDTYLANVDKVNEEKTDKNGHVTPASIDVTVYSEYAAQASKDGIEVLTKGNYETDGVFTVGDKVLVTVSEALDKNDKTVYTVQSAEAATAKVDKITEIKVGDQTTTYNGKATTDIWNVVTINRAKAVLNHTATYEPTLKVGDYYVVYYDQHGNVIGADARELNFAVLDRLQTTTTAGDSSATGTIVDFAAESASGAVNNIDRDTAEDFSTRKENNTRYYNTVYTYSEYDGTYTLRNAGFNRTTLGGEYQAKTGADSGYMQVTVVDPTDENKTVTQTLHLSKNTVALFQSKDSPDGTFAAYVGYQNLPRFEASIVEWLDTNEDGYVDYLYVLATELTSRTVFIYDVDPDYVEASDEYAGWFIGKVDALEWKDGKVEKTTVEVYFRHNFAETNMPWADIDHIGLYEIVESEYGAYYAIGERPIEGVTKVEGVGDGQRVYINGVYENLDDAVITKYTGSWTSGKTETVKADTLNAESIVVYQRNEAGKIVALYDLWIELDISIEAVDKDGKAVDLKDIKGLDISNTTWYLGKTPDAKNPIELTIPEYWDLSEVVSTPERTSGSTLKLSTKDFTAKGEDHHNKAASFEINTAKRVWGDVTITIKADPKHSSLWLIAEKPAGNRNIEVTVNTDNTITVSGSDAMTATVGDLLAWLTPECENDDAATHTKPCDHASYRVYDNTIANDVTGQTTLPLNGHNMFIIVTAENGDTAQYDVLVGKDITITADGVYVNDSTDADAAWTIILPANVSDAQEKLTVQVQRNGALDAKNRTFVVKDADGTELGQETVTTAIEANSPITIEIDNPGDGAEIKVELTVG